MSSRSEGAFCGAVCAAVAAIEMLALNRRTINPISGAVVAGVWLAAGALAGAALGVLGGRAGKILGARPAVGAGFLATITVGHLLLPLGAGPLMALVGLAVRIVRPRVAPRLSRLDRGAVLAVAVIVADQITPASSSLPPLRPDALGAGVPAPGALPVTITVHPPSPFPEVAAVHAPLRALVSDAPGVRAALLTGRLPARTGAGPAWPRALPGGGGIARVPARRGARALVSILPLVDPLEEACFRPAATLPDLTRASGIAVLTTLPRPDDPALFLRWLELETAPDPADAQRFGAHGAWMDVTWDSVRGGSLALAGQGIAPRRPDGEATLVDVAPTALHLLGLAVPRECDGRVLLECLATPGPGARRPRYRTLAPIADSAEAAPGSPVSAPTTPR